MTGRIIDEISIRRWQESDLLSAVDLNREAEKYIGMASESGDWAKDMEGITKTFIGSGGNFLVGLRGNKLVVMGGFKLLSKNTAEIKRMRVTPNLQGRGIGRWFLGLLETSMLTMDIINAEVSTTSEQTGALRLYAGAGYVEVGRRIEDREHDNGLIIVSFKKKLAITDK